MIPPYAFTAIGKVCVKDRGTVYTGYSPWDLTDGDKIDAMLGQKVTVYHDGHVRVATIKGVERAAKLPGMGDRIGVLVDE